MIEYFEREVLKEQGGPQEEREKGANSKAKEPLRGRQRETAEAIGTERETVKREKERL